MAKRGKKEGSIYKDSEGRWRAAVDYGYENGKRVRKVLSGATRAEVAAKLTVALREQQQHRPKAVERYTVGQHLEQWLKNSASSIRPKTLRTYTDITNQHLIPILGKIPLQKLTPNDVREFMDLKLKELQTRPGSTSKTLSVRSVTHFRNTLRAALSIAVSDGVVLQNVAGIAKPPRATSKHEPKFLSPEEARAFLTAVQGHRLEALFVIALYVGLRQGELLGLRWVDVDLKLGTLTVSGQLQRIDGKLQRVEPKTETSRRRVVIPEDALEVLRSHLARQENERRSAGRQWIESDMVFTTTIGTMLDARNLLKAFYGILAKGEVPKLRFHDLRHSMATLLISTGAQSKLIQEIGGWSNNRTVMDTYGHVFQSAKADAAVMMNEILRPLATSSATKGLK